MRQHFHIAVAGVLLWLAADTAIAKELRLLDGRRSFATPVDVSPSHSSTTLSEPSSTLTDLTSSDGSFAVSVTYGRHNLGTPNLVDFLREKVSSCSRFKAKVPHFRWIQHRIVERNGHQWAEICFSHDNAFGFHVYTRCLSCFVQGHLLEIWALTFRAGDSVQKGSVDELIDSVRLIS